jgi:hypothetical protein
MSEMETANKVLRFVSFKAAKRDSVGAHLLEYLRKHGPMTGRRLLDEFIPYRRQIGLDVLDHKLQTPVTTRLSGVINKKIVIGAIAILPSLLRERFEEPLPTGNDEMTNSRRCIICDKSLRGLHGNRVICMDPKCLVDYMKNRKKLSKRERAMDFPPKEKPVRMPEGTLPGSTDVFIKNEDGSWDKLGDKSTDAVIAAAVKRYEDMVDKYNDLLRFCMAIPLLVKVRSGETSRVVEIDQAYLDRLAGLVHDIQTSL